MRFSPHFYNNRADKSKNRESITEEMCIEVVTNPDYAVVQDNGNVAHWRAVDIFGDGKMRYLLVVTAHPDRDFPKEMRKIGVELP